MSIKPLRQDIVAYLKEHSLTTKWEKARRLFEKDIRHPSLNTELLEPRWRGIYSFRLDRKYRALFFINEEGKAEIVAITNHYKK